MCPVITQTDAIGLHHDGSTTGNGERATRACLGGAITGLGGAWTKHCAVTLRRHFNGSPEKNFNSATCHLNVRIVSTFVIIGVISGLFKRD
jgi:hypothetical protein